MYISMKVKGHSVVSDFFQPHGLYSPRNSPGQNTGMGSRSLLQGIFPTQGSKPGLPHCRQILYQLNHQGSPKYILSVPRGIWDLSFWPGIELGPLHWKLRALTTELPGRTIIPIVKGKLEEIFESLSDEKHIMVVFVNKIPSGLYYTQNVFLRKCLSKLLPWDNWVYDIITLMLNLLWLTK